MINWGEYSYSSNQLEDIKIDGVLITKKEILSEIRELRKLGLVDMYRGGLDEDGQVVGGTHFGIPYSKKDKVRNLLTD